MAISKPIKFGQKLCKKTSIFSISKNQYHSHAWNLQQSGGTGNRPQPFKAKGVTCLSLAMAIKSLVKMHIQNAKRMSPPISKKEIPRYIAIR